MSDVEGSGETSMGRVAFATVFVPEGLAGSRVAQLLTYAGFAVAFVVRPVGGAVFGHFGDRVGRKSMLILSLLLMGLATFLIGTLPGYASIGVAAPVLLAVLLATEHATHGRRGLYSSFPQMGPAAGFLVANVLFIVLVSTLSAEQFVAWGWRVPFLFSIVLVAVGLYVRVSIAETPVFRRAMETQARARVPALDMVRTYPKVLLLASGGISLAYVLFYTITTFSLSYGTDELGMANSTLLYATLISVSIMGVAVPAFATLSDRLGRRRLCMAGALLALVWAFPMFWLFDTGNPVLITIAFSVGMLAFAVLYGPMGAYLPELFGTRLRYSGASVSYNLGGVLGGAFAPILAASLLILAGGSWAISLYIALMALLSFACVFFLSETHLTDISEVQEEERNLLAEEGAVPK
ncbi:MAG: MFS transporter [Rubrobacter sp.]|nr:MFS transporter [Rubrobacter sp.]